MAVVIPTTRPQSWRSLASDEWTGKTGRNTRCGPKLRGPTQQWATSLRQVFFNSLTGSPPGKSAKRYCRNGEWPPVSGREINSISFLLVYGNRHYNDNYIPIATLFLGFSQTLSTSPENIQYGGPLSLTLLWHASTPCCFQVFSKWETRLTGSWA
jgi:hypothetical protein